MEPILLTTLGVMFAVFVAVMAYIAWKKPRQVDMATVRKIIEATIAKHVSERHTKKAENKRPTKKTAKKKPARKVATSCRLGKDVGYLSSLPEDAPMPDECWSCESQKDCLGD